MKMIESGGVFVLIQLYYLLRVFNHHLLQPHLQLLNLPLQLLLPPQTPLQHLNTPSHLLYLPLELGALGLDSLRVVSLQGHELAAQGLKLLVERGQVAHVLFLFALEAFLLIEVELFYL